MVLLIPQVTTVKARGVAYAEPPNPGYNQRGDTKKRRRDSPLAQPPKTRQACPQGAQIEMTTLGDDIEVREGTYGEKIIAVEPGGAEFIPLNERHGRPEANTNSTGSRPASGDGPPRKGRAVPSK